MPDGSSTFVKGYIARLKETLGSGEPAEIARTLGITYQAAKNYLEGRLPSADVLITIANKTDYSLNWLLTGKGAKKVAGASKGSNDPLTTQGLELIIRRIAREEIAGQKKGSPVIKVGAKKEKKQA